MEKEEEVIKNNFLQTDSFDEIESLIKNSRYHYGAVRTPNQQLYKFMDFVNGVVEITPANTTLYKNGVCTHNHPTGKFKLVAEKDKSFTGNSFSFEDLESSTVLQLTAIRAVTPFLNGFYEFRKLKNKTLQFDEVHKIWEAFNWYFYMDREISDLLGFRRSLLKEANQPKLKIYEDMALVSHEVFIKCKPDLLTEDLLYDYET